VPARITAIGRLAGALNRLQEQQLPANLSGPPHRMLEAIAPTMLSAGVKENVLPQPAQAIVNFRLLPGQSIEQVAVARHGLASSEPSKISGLDSLGYQALNKRFTRFFRMLSPCLHCYLRRPIHGITQVFQNRFLVLPL